MVPCFPRASRSSRFPSVVPSVAAACFWLVVVCCFADWRPFKATTYFIFFIFCRSICRPQTIHQRPLPHLPLSAPPLYHPPLRFRRLSVDCCFSSSNGGHLRPRPRPPLCFLMGCVSTPQTRDRGAARAHPMARAFHGPIGSGGAMI